MKKFFLLIITAFILFAAPASSEEDIVTALLSEEHVIFLGESHTSKRDHQGQLEILETLVKSQDRPIILVLEMFDERSSQQLLNFSENGNLNSEFWDEQWGHPFDLYEPILEWSRVQKLRLTHLRPDPARTKAVREGDALGEFRSLGDFYLGPPAYRDFMADVAAQHLPQEMKVTDSIVDKYFLIQCFWDEYMSWRLTQLLEENPEALLVVLVGHGHLHPDFGIPRRLQRRRPNGTLLTVGFEKESDWQPDVVW